MTTLIQSMNRIEMLIHGREISDAFWDLHLLINQKENRDLEAYSPEVLYQAFLFFIRNQYDTERTLDCLTQLKLLDFYVTVRLNSHVRDQPVNIFKLIKQLGNIMKQSDVGQYHIRFLTCAQFPTLTPILYSSKIFRHSEKRPSVIVFNNLELSVSNRLNVSQFKKLIPSIYDAYQFLLMKDYAETKNLDINTNSLVSIVERDLTLREKFYVHLKRLRNMIIERDEEESIFAKMEKDALICASAYANSVLGKEIFYYVPDVKSTENSRLVTLEG